MQSLLSVDYIILIPRSHACTAMALCVIIALEDRKILINLNVTFLSFIGKLTGRQKDRELTWLERVAYTMVLKSAYRKFTSW